LEISQSYRKKDIYQQSTMANRNFSPIEDRKVERKTLKQRARALLLTPSSYYPAPDNNKKTKAVASRAASDEMAVQRKVSFMQELQESVSTEFNLKVSTPTPMTPNWAINATQHAKQHPDDSNTVLVAVLTLALLACCIVRAAACCLKFKSRVSVVKQDFDDETNKTFQNAYDHYGVANNMASKCEQKQSFENELRATVGDEEEQNGHNVLDLPSEVSTGVEKVEDLPPQLIFEVATSGIETSKHSSSAGSTTGSTVFTISTAGETKDDDNCSIDTETAGDSAKMASFCSSPLKAQEFERNLTDEATPAMTNISAASFNKKGSMSKKTLDTPIEDVEESAVLGKDVQALFGVAMKVAVAVVAVNVLVLTRRR
jgi:hypothetical protein